MLGVNANARIWVKYRHCGTSDQCPLFLRKRTSAKTQKVRCIAHKTVDCHGRAPGVNHWHAIPGSQRDDLIGIGEKRNIMGSGQSSVLTGMLGMNGRAPPHKRMLRSSLSGASNMPNITDRRCIDLRDRR